MLLWQALASKQDLAKEKRQWCDSGSINGKEVAKTHLSISWGTSWFEDTWSSAHWRRWKDPGGAWMLPGRTKSHIRLKTRNSASEMNLSEEQSLHWKFTSRHVCLSWSSLCCLILQLSWLRHKGVKQAAGYQRTCLGRKESSGSLGSQPFAISAIALLYWHISVKALSAALRNVKY